MFRLPTILALVLFSASSLSAQTVYTRPLVPAPRDLDRLNLELEWQTSLPVENHGDGVVSVQLIEDQAFVQMRSGPLVVLSSRTGELVWKSALPKKYAPVLPVAVNATRVFVANGPYLYVIDRKTGRTIYKVDLPSMAAVPPVADISGVYLALTNNRMIAFGYQQDDIVRGLRQPKRYASPEPPSGATVAPDALDELATSKNPSPSVGLLHTLRPPFRTVTKDETPSFNMLPTLMPPYRLDVANRTPSIGMGQTSVSRTEELSAVNTLDRPKMFWELQTYRHIDYPPLLFRERIIAAGNDRTLFACRKFVELSNVISQEFQSDSFISAPMGQYGDEFYVPLSDSNVLAFNVEMFRYNDLPVRPLRKYMVGTSLDRKPLVTDDSIYLASSTAGLTRINRRTFEKLWQNAEVERVLTVNTNLVYALDRRGNLLILDKSRGLKLSSFDIRGFQAVVNEQDDRLYLTASSGLMLCLHDRSFVRPELLKKKEPKPIVEVAPLEPVAPKREEVKIAPAPKKEEMKKDEPKKEELKKEEPKKEEMKKEEPKKEEPKKVDTDKE